MGSLTIFTENQTSSGRNRLEAFYLGKRLYTGRILATNLLTGKTTHKRRGGLIMRLYTPPSAPDLMRINIKRSGESTAHIPVIEATQWQLMSWIQKIIASQNLSIFANGHRLTIEVRESIGGINGKVMSVSLFGMSVRQAEKLILEELTKIN